MKIVDATMLKREPFGTYLVKIVEKKVFNSPKTYLIANFWPSSKWYYLNTEEEFTGWRLVKKILDRKEKKEKLASERAAICKK